MQLQRERGIITNYFLERRYGSSGGKVALTYFFMPMSLIPPEAKLQSTYMQTLNSPSSWTNTDASKRLAW